MASQREANGRDVANETLRPRAKELDVQDL